MSGVLVVIESRDGKLRKASREALSIGRKLAESWAGELAGFAADAGAADEAGRHGVRRLFVGEAGSYATDSWTAALAAAVREARPSVLLLGGTSNGRDLAPRIAARLGVGVVTDVDSVEWTGDRLRARRPVYSSKVFATVELTGSPAVATTRPNAFPPEEVGGAPAEVVRVVFEPGETRVRLVETKLPEAGEVSIAEADIIVSGGRGLKEAANFSYIRDLASALGGAVGASRATVDAGWIDHQHQVGQTGRVVSPNLYIAAGVSGAIQHLAGMSSAKHIVAINKDPEAPIFRVADLGIVGDLFQILPLVTEEVKKVKAS